MPVMATEQSTGPAIQPEPANLTIIPLNQGRNNAPPPSSDEVINLEASPPANQSFVRRVWEARKNSNGFLDSLRKVYVIFLGTIGCSILLAFFYTIPVSMIVIGAMYLGECPVQQYIPVYLIVGGTFGILEHLFGYDSENELALLICGPCNRIMQHFNFAWFITGCVWTYSAYEPEYEDISNPFYCNKTLYLFTFWLLNAGFIILGSVIIILCCSVIMVLFLMND